MEVALIALVFFAVIFGPAIMMHHMVQHGIYDAGINKMDNFINNLNDTPCPKHDDDD